ncbi:hypothetical protein RDI58_020742 [Solanum bulbocastanum]|uniref:Uncharacterized protein n=1 Tax=Solanum bulbocastanum TaxID=147425 RepID=A0AAN8TFT6_SOLBU
MEALSSSQQSLRCCERVEDGKVECKCAEGWSCSVTKTESSKAGKPFCQCSSGTTCTRLEESDPEAQKAVEGSESDGYKVICKTEAGYTCKISKAGEVIAECGEGCICIVDETGNVKCITKATETSCCASGCN